MDSESKWEKTVDSNIFSILGALFGGFTGSLASRAFGGTTALNLITGSFILGIGVILGVMIGVRLSEGLIRKHFNKSVEQRFENVALGGFAILGGIVALIGSTLFGMVLGSSSISNITINLLGEISISLLIILIGILIFYIGFGNILNN